MTDAQLQQRVIETYERMRKKNETLKAEIKANEQETATVKGLIAQMSTQIAALETSLSNNAPREEVNYEQELKDAEKERKDGVTKLQQVKEACEKAIYSLCDERKQKSKILAKKKEARADLAKMTEAVKQMKAQPNQKKVKEDLSVQLHEHQLKSEDSKLKLDSQIAKVQEELSEAEAEGVRLAKLLEEKNNLIQELEQRIGRRDSTKDDLESRLQSLVDQQESMAQTQKDMAAQQAALKKTTEEMAQAHARVQAETKQIAKKLEKEHSKMLAFTKQVETATPKFKAQSDALAAELAESQRRALEAVEERSAETDRKIDEHKKALEELKRARASVSKQLEQTQQDIDAEKRQFQTVREQYNIRFEAMQKIISTYSLASITSEPLPEVRVA